MIAKISVSGTLARGIRIDVILPDSFLGHFTHGAGIEVCGEALYVNWGHKVEDGRANTCRVWSRAEMDNRLADIRAELTLARAALAPITEGDIEVEL